MSAAPDPFDMHGGLPSGGFRMSGAFPDEIDVKAYSKEAAKAMASSLDPLVMDALAKAKHIDPQANCPHGTPGHIQCSECWIEYARKLEDEISALLEVVKPDPIPQKYTPKYYAGTEATVTVPPKTCAKDFLQELDENSGPVDRFVLKHGLVGLLNEFLVYLDHSAAPVVQSPPQSEFDLEG